MKISELIKSLKRAKVMYGDLPVTRPANPEWGGYDNFDAIELDGIYNECTTSPNYGRKPRFVILVGATIFEEAEGAE